MRGEFPFWSFPLKKLFPVQQKDKNKAKYMTSGVLRRELSGGELGFERSREFTYEIQHLYRTYRVKSDRETTHGLW